MDDVEVKRQFRIFGGVVLAYIIAFFLFLSSTHLSGQVAVPWVLIFLVGPISLVWAYYFGILNGVMPTYYAGSILISRGPGTRSSSWLVIILGILCVIAGVLMLFGVTLPITLG